MCEPKQIVICDIKPYEGQGNLSSLWPDIMQFDP